MVIDTGALIAWERATRTMVALVAEARAIGTTLTVPAGCVAQAWRNPRRQARLAALLRRPEINIVPLDASDARRVGVLLASTQTTDTVDAHVAVCALRRGQPVLTSDPGDLARLSADIRTVRV
ncbi:PIN domain-containing protein [Candidatus Poriferisodalis sp.]|uniref:PIN domain-containing protein n=1 Tax=Candidatus Poriferisodalis sp. TaxID=3101277 RepID=UPI003B0262A8